ncbi:MAG: hypothetical protein MUC84_11180 [Solirubrobacteraceae bacterium]|jgi:hypothetical protein|nr:hypothetical protein [Solirubrobacteraceae bacterium]
MILAFDPATLFLLLILLIAGPVLLIGLAVMMLRARSVTQETPRDPREETAPRPVHRVVTGEAPESRSAPAPPADRDR